MTKRSTNSLSSPNWRPSARPAVALTMGDPMGIGAEVLLSALSDTTTRGWARWIIIGNRQILERECARQGWVPDWEILDPEDPRPHNQHDLFLLDVTTDGLDTITRPAPSKPGGSASIHYLDQALMLIGLGYAQALATAPICKASWDLAGFRRYPGHTEFLQARTRSNKAVMAFDAPDLRVALATVHEPLLGLRDSLSIGKVYDAIDMGAKGCQLLGVDNPRIAVCGLNPHASEDGLFGCEEERVITPAIRMAQNQGLRVEGPFPADSLFTPRQREKFDLIVAMYHDQGLIPVKMIAFDSAVNITLGLPFVRTSPDHGTAFEIAGKGIADSGSMKSAMILAARCALQEVPLSW